jgi:L-malate glycosyltransferase
MNILFLSSWYPTNENPNFGIFVKEHAHAIKSVGNEIIVLALVVSRDKKLYSSTVTDFIDEKGVRTVVIEIKSCFRDILYHLVHFQYLLILKTYNRKIAPTFNPDIIHSNVIFPAGILGNKFALSINKPHVITEHWSRINGLLKKPILGKMAIKSYQEAARIFPVSDFLKKRMLELIPSLDSSKFKKIGNVIDSNTFYFKKKISDPDSIHFCAIATWANKKTPDKLPELFIEALSAIQLKTQKQIKLTMVGGGDRVEELKELSKKQPYKTEFVNYQTKDQINEILQNSDFFVHSSTIETFGVVIVEALMTGTPVICSSVGALPELVNETNGVLCNNTKEEWVEGIEKAINKKFNLEDIAKNVLFTYNSKTIGKQILSVYKNL